MLKLKTYFVVLKKRWTFFHCSLLQFMIYASTKSRKKTVTPAEVDNDTVMSNDELSTEITIGNHRCST